MELFPVSRNQLNCGKSLCAYPRTLGLPYWGILAYGGSSSNHLSRTLGIPQVESSCARGHRTCLPCLLLRTRCESRWRSTHTTTILNTMIRDSMWKKYIKFLLLEWLNQKTIRKPYSVVEMQRCNNSARITYQRKHTDLLYYSLYWPMHARCHNLM